MNIDEKQVRFFYAQEAEAGMYDNTINLVVPLYTHLHQMLIELIKRHVTKYREVLTTPVTVLDIGFGTGAESVGLKRQLPACRIVGLDLCKPMLDAFQEKGVGEQTLRENIHLMEGDFVDDAGLPTSKIIEASPNGKHFSVLMTAFTFHHFTIEEKLAAYRKAYALLEPGGLFVNGDLFNFSSRLPKEWRHREIEFSSLPRSANLTEHAHRFDIEFIDQSFRKEISMPRNKRLSGLSTEKLKELKARWVHHYQTFNILDSAEIQAAMLNECGFAETGIPFRYWQVGIVYGRKPGTNAKTGDENAKVRSG